MPGRNASSGVYRYAFGGQEKDNEISGVEGSLYTAPFWQYDSRLGRRWNRDPIVKAWETPYGAFANNPISIIDPTGLDSVNVTGDGDGPLVFDPTKDTGVLPEFTVDGGENPLTLKSDNTNVQTFVEPRNPNQVIRDNNIAIIQSNIDHNPKFVGKLLSINSPLSLNEKKSLLSYKMQSGRGARFYQGFGLAVLGGAGLGAAGSLGLLGGTVNFGTVSLNLRISSLVTTNLGRANLGFGIGNAATNFGLQWGFSGDIGDVNMTSVASSFLFKHPFTASITGSGFGYSFNKGRTGFGSGRPLLSITTEIGIWTLAGFGLNAANSHIGFTTSSFGNIGIGTATATQFNTLGIGITNAINQEQ